MRTRILMTLGLVALLVGCAAPGLIDEQGAGSYLLINGIEPTSDPFGDIITSSGIIPDDVVLVELTAHLKATGGSGPGTRARPIRPTARQDRGRSREGSPRTLVAAWPGFGRSFRCR